MAAISSHNVEAHQDQTVDVVDVDEALVEQVWRELYGTVSRTQIRQMVVEAASEFADASISTYVPIFVRRQVLAQLGSVLREEEVAQVQHISRSALKISTNGGD